MGVCLGNWVFKLVIQFFKGRRKITNKGKGFDPRMTEVKLKLIKAEMTALSANLRNTLLYRQIIKMTWKSKTI